MKRTTVYCFLFSLALLPAIPASGQMDTGRLSKKDFLHYRTPFFSIFPRLYNNGKDLSNEAAIQLLSSEPAALGYYRKYRNKQKAGLYSFIGMFGLIGTSSYFMEKGNRGGVGMSLTLSFASFINSIVFLSVADKRLRQAIQTYNRYSLGQ